MKRFIGLILIFSIINLFAAETRRYGNYSEKQIFDRTDSFSAGIVFFPDSELLYDFDTENPLRKLFSNNNISSSTDFYMSSPNSLKWNSVKNGSISFQAGFFSKNTPEFNNSNHLSFGLFQTTLPENLRTFKIQLLGRNDKVLLEKNFSLCRAGWNLFCKKISNDYIRKIKITQIAGDNGIVYLDNLLIAHTVGEVGSNYNSKNDSLLYKNELINKKYPLKKLTEEEINAIEEITNRVMPAIEKAKIPNRKMQKYRNYYDSWNIEVKGDFANGEFPLSYSRKTAGTYSELGENTYMYRRNETLCSTLRLIALDYAAASGNQKNELAKYIVNLSKLALTYGLIPNPWYNGRGFVEGVFYGREALEEAGILDKIVTQLFEQYEINNILFTPHILSKPPIKSPKGSEFGWKATADDLNTANRSTLLLLLIAKNSPEKARNLYRFKSYLDNISLMYAPSSQGTLKPDGSLFHHWGNRFDDYGWTAGWRGATEYIYWLSKTPFAVSKATHQRFYDAAKVRFKVVSPDNYVGGADNLNKVNNSGYMNLALAGSIDQKEAVDKLMTSYFLASDEEDGINSDKLKDISSYLRESILKNKVQKDNFRKAVSNGDFEVAKFTNNNVTLSYAHKNIHTVLPWKIYTHGLSKYFYNTQYIRDGWLFFNIGALSMWHKGCPNGFLANYGKNLSNRDKTTNKFLVPGYNLSLATGVTSKPAEFKNLTQFYYQSGSDGFVGGVSTSNGNGIFAQKFDSSLNRKYSTTEAKNFKFLKSYFYFGDKIVALASDIAQNNSANNLESGVFQESAKNNKNIIKVPNNIDCSKEINKLYNTNEVNYLYNNDTQIGIYFMENQKIQLFRGQQLFGNSKGFITSAYLKHDQKINFYEWIMLINTTLSRTQDFAKKMSSSSSPIKVLRRDSKAHIVKDLVANQVGYVVFDYQNLNFPANEVLENISNNSIILVQQNGNHLTISASSPDLNFNSKAPAGAKFSVAVPLTIKLSGLYKFIDLKNTNNVKLCHKNSSTVISFILKDGLTQDLELIKY